MDGSRGADVELTAQETALYDRQIRVWGVDAQKRLSKAHVLVCGMNGTTIEFCKNIVLAGVGSLSLMDDHIVTEDDLNSNFLIPPNDGMYGGKCRADVCCESLKDFNPMVRVSVEKGDPSLIDGEFLDKFDIVVVSCASLKTKLSINDNCRKRSKRIAFYTIECKDSCGEIFVDLQKHSYVQKVVAKPPLNRSNAAATEGCKANACSTQLQSSPDHSRGVVCQEKEARTHFLVVLKADEPQRRSLQEKLNSRS